MSPPNPYSHKGKSESLPAKKHPFFTPKFRRENCLKTAKNRPLKKSQEEKNHNDN